MEIRAIIVLVFFAYNICYCQDFKNKSWSFSTIHSLNNNMEDSTMLYSKINNIKKINIGNNNKLVFYNDNTYIMTFNNIVRQSGNWKTENNNLILDNDTLLILKNTNQVLRLRGKSPYFDSNNHLRIGFIITEYENVIEIVETVNSGNWNDYLIWSSGRVPNRSDKVTIKQNHIVELRLNELGFCKDIVIEKGAIFNCSTDKSLSINPLD